MKRILSALLLSLCLIAVGFQAEAKSPKRSNSKAKTTRTITVQKNQMGYADPTGHTYTASMEGIGMTMAFYKNKTMTLEIKGYYRPKRPLLFGNRADPLLRCTPMTANPLTPSRFPRMVADYT